MKEIYTVYKDTRNMSRAEWLSARKAGIGGSDAAAIIGLNPFSSPLAVWADKTSTDEPQEESENEAIWLGNVLEDHVARRYAEESGLNIVRCNQMMQSIEHPFMLANIDRRVKGKRIGVEIKTTSSFTKTDFAGGDVNPWYYAQCMHYLAVTGWDEWKLVVLVIGRGMYTYSFKRKENEDQIKALISAEDYFWHEYVLQGKCPPVDGSKAADEILAKRYPVSDGSTITLDCDDAISQYMTLTSKIKELEGDKALYEQRIKECMGESERGESANYVVSWKNSSPRKTIDTKRLTEEHPEIVDRYIKIGAPTRRFMVKEA